MEAPRIRVKMARQGEGAPFGATLFSSTDVAPTADVAPAAPAGLPLLASPDQTAPKRYPNVAQTLPNRSSALAGDGSHQTQPLTTYSHVVAEIKQGTPAEGKLKVGDKLMTINGRNALTMDFSDVTKLMKSYITLDISVSRGGPAAAAAAKLKRDASEAQEGGSSGSGGGTRQKGSRRNKASLPTLTLVEQYGVLLDEAELMHKEGYKNGFKLRKVSLYESALTVCKLKGASKPSFILPLKEPGCKVANVPIDDLLKKEQSAAWICAWAYERATKPSVGGGKAEKYKPHVFAASALPEKTAWMTKIQAQMPASGAASNVPVVTPRGKSSAWGEMPRANIKLTSTFKSSPLWDMHYGTILETVPVVVQALKIGHMSKAQFVDEADKLKIQYKSSKSIVQLITCSTSEQPFWVVMELWGNGSLLDCMKASVHTHAAAHCAVAL